jgi:uncharacterized membrane protein (UPF0182 family)
LQRITLPSASSRGRRVAIVVAAVVAGVIILFTALSGFFVDLLWFREVGFSQVFWTI